MQRKAVFRVDLNMRWGGGSPGPRSPRSCVGTAFNETGVLAPGCWKAASPPFCPYQFSLQKWLSIHFCCFCVHFIFLEGVIFWGYLALLQYGTQRSSSFTDWHQLCPAFVRDWLWHPRPNQLEPAKTYTPNLSNLLHEFPVTAFLGKGCTGMENTEDGANIMSQ